MTSVRSDRTRGTRWVETIAIFTTGLYAKSSLIPSQIDETGLYAHRLSSGELSV